MRSRSATRNQEGFSFPCRFGHLLLYALNRDRLLRCRHQQSVVCGTLGRDSIGETLGRHPEKPVLVGRKRRSARTRRSAVEEFADCLAFVRRHRCDINKSLHLGVPATRSRDNRAPVGVTHQQHQPASSDSELSGICTATACNPLRWRGGMILPQLDASAHAACTRTTVGTERLVWVIVPSGRKTRLGDLQKGRVQSRR